MAALVWEIGHVAEQARILTQRLVDELRARNAEGAMAVGISVLGNIQDAYRAKARHGTGEDGIKWRDLSPATLEARVRRRAPARNIVAERLQIAQEIRGILSGGITPRSKRGKKKAIDPDVAVAALREKRAALSRKIDNLVSAEMSSYEIGVDTGLQINSASPGFSDPVWKRTPTDSLGHNVFFVDGGNVTIGYDRTYSAAFDHDRKLIPDTLPAPWEVEANDAFTTWADLIIKAGEN